MPRREDVAGQDDRALELPWLQAVKEKAVSPTTGLDGTKMEDQAEGESEGSTDLEGERQVTPRVQVEPQTTGEAHHDPVEPPDAPPPNWVVGILEPSSSQAAPEGSYEPEELAHIMPWAHKGAESESATDEETEAAAPEGAVTESTTPGLPPWLGGVTVQETLQSLPSQEPRSTELAEMGIEGIEPFSVPVGEEAGGLPDQLPDFVRTLGGESQAQGTTDDAPTRPAPRMITTPPTDFAVDEGMAGLVAHDTPVRAPRPGSVETLASLLQPAGPDATHRVVPMPTIRSRSTLAAEATHKAAQQGRGRVARWLLPDGLIYLLVLAALLAVVIIRPPFGDTPASPAPGVAAFYATIDSVPLDRPVLVVYDWDAGRSAEMSVMSRAVMHHIMTRHLSFVTVSTVPQGPGFAQEITDALRAGATYEYGKDYLVLGYLPGSEAALRTLVGSFRAVLPLDYVNSRPVGSYQLTAGGALNKIEDFALIVDLAGSEAEMRNWIEQVASRTNVPVVAAVPQGLEPMARPYLGVPGARLEAVVSGTTGAYAYMRQLEANGLSDSAFTRSVDLTTRLNAQSIAALLVALVIVAAFLSQGARRIMRRG